MARIRERTPGVWQVTVSTGRDPLTGRYGQISRHVHGSRRTANQLVAELAAEVAQNLAGVERSSISRVPRSKVAVEARLKVDRHGFVE
jgi:hypothetical protein